MPPLDEDALLRRAARLAAGDIPAGWVGPGDDAALVPRGDGWLVVSTDLSVEGTHFRREWASPRVLGGRAVRVAISDLAAMGADPLGVLVSAALPADLPEGFAEELIAGIEEAAGTLGAPLLGGDLAGTAMGIVLDVTVLGEAPRERVRLRSGGRSGDVLAVTGSLGLARAGLHLLEAGRAPAEAAAVRRFLVPEPRLAEGRWLAGRPEVRAMMDLSDGLAVDAPRLAAASGCGVVLELDHVPRNPEADIVAREAGEDPVLFAAAGGEDYELLVAVEPGAFEALAGAFVREFGRPLSPVGRLLEDPARREAVRNGVPVAFPAPGFTHFRGEGG